MIQKSNMRWMWRFSHTPLHRLRSIICQISWHHVAFQSFSGQKCKLTLFLHLRRSWVWKKNDVLWVTTKRRASVYGDALASSFWGAFFSLPLLADDYKCFRSMKRKMNSLFLIQLKADWCVVLFRGETIKHSLHLHQNKKNKLKNERQKLHNRTLLQQL